MCAIKMYGGKPAPGAAKLLQGKWGPEQYLLAFTLTDDWPIGLNGAAGGFILPAGQEVLVIVPYQLFFHISTTCGRYGIPIGDVYDEEIAWAAPPPKPAEEQEELPF